MPQVKATNCSGHLDITPQELTVQFNSVRVRTLKIDFLELERAVKSGRETQVGGITVQPHKRTKRIKFLRWHASIPYYEIYLFLHQPVQGSDLMVLSRHELLFALRNVS